MTIVIVVLLLLGALLELGGLLTIARDVRDAAAETAAIAAESETVMAANKHVVADWIRRATVGTVGNLQRRRRGLVAFGLGLLLQTVANLIALGH